MSTLFELFWCAALLHVLYKWQVFFFCEELRLQAMNSVRKAGEPAPSDADVPKEDS